jgi:phosphate:Na+ symporter
MGNQTLVLIEKGIDTALKGSLSELNVLRKGDEAVDQGQEEILTFLRSIKGNSVSEKEMKRLEQQIEAVNILETAADLITTVLVEAAEHRIEHNLSASPETSEKLTGLYRLAYGSFRSAMKTFGGEETEDYEEFSKESFKSAYQKVRSYLAQRLTVTNENHILLYRFESEVLEAIRRLHSLSRRLGRKAK